MWSQSCPNISLLKGEGVYRVKCFSLFWLHVLLLQSLRRFSVFQTFTAAVAIWLGRSRLIHSCQDMSRVPQSSVNTFFKIKIFIQKYLNMRSTACSRPGWQTPPFPWRHFHRDTNFINLLYTCVLRQDWSKTDSRPNWRLNYVISLGDRPPHIQDGSDLLSQEGLLATRDLTPNVTETIMSKVPKWRTGVDYLWVLKENNEITIILSVSLFVLERKIRFGV
jgi:hypothetical protein